MEDSDHQKKQLEIQKLSIEIELLKKPWYRAFRDQPVIFITLITGIIGFGFLLSNSYIQRDAKFAALEKEKSQLNEKNKKLYAKNGELSREKNKLENDLLSMENKQINAKLQLSKDSLANTAMEIERLIAEKEVAKNEIVKSNLKINQKENDYLNYLLEQIIKTGYFEFYSSEFDHVVKAVKREYRPNWESIITGGVGSNVLMKAYDTISIQSPLRRLAALEILSVATKDERFSKEYFILANSLVRDKSLPNANILLNYFFNTKWDNKTKAALTGIFSVKLADTSTPTLSKIQLLIAITDKAYSGNLELVQTDFVFEALKVSNSYLKQLEKLDSVSYDQMQLMKYNGVWPLTRFCAQAFLMNELKYASSRTNWEELMGDKFNSSYNFVADTNGLKMHMSGALNELVLIKEFFKFRQDYYWSDNQNLKFNIERIKGLEDNLNYKAIPGWGTFDIWRSYSNMQPFGTKYQYLIDRWTDPNLVYFENHKEEFIYCIINHKFQRKYGPNQ